MIEQQVFLMFVCQWTSNYSSRETDEKLFIKFHPFPFLFFALSSVGYFGKSDPYPPSPEAQAQCIKRFINLHYYKIIVVVFVVIINIIIITIIFYCY